MWMGAVCAQLGRKLLPVNVLSRDKEMGQNGIQSSQTMGSLRPAGPHLHWDSVHTAAVVTLIFVDSLKQVCDWACRLASAGHVLHTEERKEVQKV